MLRGRTDRKWGGTKYVNKGPKNLRSCERHFDTSACWLSHTSVRLLSALARVSSSLLPARPRTLVCVSVCTFSGRSLSFPDVCSFFFFFPLSLQRLAFGLISSCFGAQEAFQRRPSCLVLPLISEEPLCRRPGP